MSARRLIHTLAALFAVLMVLPGDASAQSITSLRSRCDANDYGACDKLGFAYQKGANGVAQDFREAHTYFQKACNGNRGAQGCLGAAQVRAKLQISESEYRTNCNSGDLISCFELGFAYVWGDKPQIPRNVPKGIGMLEGRCPEGLEPTRYVKNPGLCHDLGVIHQFGVPGKAPDPAAALRVFKDNCDKFMGSCVSAADVLVSMGQEASQKEAMQLYSKACFFTPKTRRINYHIKEQVHMAMGCGKGASLALSRSDTKTAVGLARKGCSVYSGDTKDPLACSIMGAMHEQDGYPDAAAKAFEVACKAKLEGACASQARNVKLAKEKQDSKELDRLAMSRNLDKLDRVLPQSEAIDARTVQQDRAFFAAQCAPKNNEACLTASLSYVFHPDRSRTKLGVEHLQKLCRKARYAPACAELAEFQMATCLTPKGASSTASCSKRAEKLLVDACTMRDAWSCHALGHGTLMFSNQDFFDPGARYEGDSNVSKREEWAKKACALKPGAFIQCSK